MSRASLKVLYKDECIREFKGSIKAVNWLYNWYKSSCYTTLKEKHPMISSEELDRLQVVTQFKRKDVDEGLLGFTLDYSLTYYPNLVVSDTAKKVLIEYLKTHNITTNKLVRKLVVDRYFRLNQLVSTKHPNSYSSGSSNKFRTRARHKSNFYVSRSLRFNLDAVLLEYFSLHWNQKDREAIYIKLETFLAVLRHVRINSEISKKVILNAFYELPFQLTGVFLSDEKFKEFFKTLTDR